MHFDLVLFDCDGVLVDSEPLAARVLAECIQEVGVPIDAQRAFTEFVGGKLADVIEWTESRLGRPLPEGWGEQFRERSYEVFRRELRPVAGVSEVLERLDRRQAQYCVASSGPREKMQVTLGASGLLPRFAERMFSAYEIGRWKPEPDLFLHVAATLGVEPERCAVVEDSPRGVEAGRRAGMQVFGYTERQDGGTLEAAGARVFRSMFDLPGLLGLERSAANE